MEPIAPALAELLVVERAAQPLANEGMRRRVLARTRMLVAARNPFRSRRPALGGVRWLAAAAVLAVAVVASGAALYSWQSQRPRSARPEPPRHRTEAVTPSPSLVPASSSAPSETQVPRAAAAMPRAVAPARPASSGASYGTEIHLLDPARVALAARDFARVISATNEHRRRFPAGRLTEEREALRVKALFGLGLREEGRRAVGAFRRKFPRSMLLPQLEQAERSAP